MKNKLNKNFWNKHGHVVIIYVFLVALMLLVSVFSRDFFTIGNFKNLLRTSFPLLMVALGQTLIILTGGIDLSLGGIVALANVVCVMTMNTESPVGFILPLIAAVVLGLVCGALNGVLVTRGNLAPIIVTIATTAIFDGCALLLMPKPGGSVHKAFSKFLTRGLKGAVPLILFLVILILVRTLTNQTPYGKALRAIGGSENAAYSTGVKVKKVKFIAYCLAGLLCAAAGIFLSAQMNSADATIGKNYAMNAITATVVGGTAMTGAVGDPLGTIAGVFIISIINNMLNLFGVSSFYQFVCQGLILILLLVLAQILSPGYLNPTHMAGILRLASFMGIAAIGQNLTILTGGIDLSIANTITFANVIAAQIMMGRDSSMLPALLAVIVMGIVVGLINGTGVYWLKIPPFIMTLGVGTVIQGIFLIYTKGAPKGNAAPLLRSICGQSMYGIVSGIVLIWAVLAVIAIVLLHKTPYGRKLYSVGINEEASRFSGINTGRVTFSVYLISAVIAAVSGFLLVGYTGTSFLDVGTSYNTKTIAAVVIGGTAITGGKGGYLGTIAGAVIMTILDDFLTIVSIPDAGRQVVQGIIIILLVLVYSREKKK